MRSISRVADVSINTVSKLLVDAGKACAAFHDEKVQHPMPLQIMQGDAPDRYRLYLGRNFVVLRRP